MQSAGGPGEGSRTHRSLVVLMDDWSYPEYHAAMRTRAVAAEARLRHKSQITLPEAVVAAADVQVGDRFVVEVSPDEPDTIRFHRIRDTYAGSLAEVFDDSAAYLAGERASWDRGG